MERASRSDNMHRQFLMIINYAIVVLFKQRDEQEDKERWESEKRQWPKKKKGEKKLAMSPCLCVKIKRKWMRESMKSTKCLSGARKSRFSETLPRP